MQGVLGQVIPQLRQLFERLPAAAAAADADARFEHFRANVWPRIKETGAKGASLAAAFMLLGTRCSQKPVLQALQMDRPPSRSLS